MEDLAKEKLEPDENWDKNEAYMVQLVLPKSLYSRLKVWNFKSEWAAEKEICINFHARMMAAYKEIKENKHFLKIVGLTLAIGNILNGGTPKGRADGFDLPVLGKLVSMKDNTNQTLMQLICKKIFEEDDTITNSINGVAKAVTIKETDLKYFKTKSQSMQALIGTARANLAQVHGSGEDPDQFMQIAESVVKQAGDDIVVLNKNLQEALDEHKFMLNYFGIDKNDDMVEDSTLFFKFF